ncbi:MAG TPA: AsmA family protein [bacterium]|nr:AsmA family protein [bacterium]
MKRVILILGAAGAVLVLAIVIFILTFSLNDRKPRIEEAVSKAMKMEVRINGQLKLMLFPHIGVLAKDLLIQNEGVDVGTAEEAKVGLRLLPLLRRKILVKKIWLTAPTFFITVNQGGHSNLETLAAKVTGPETPRSPFELEKLFVTKGHLLYRNERTGRQAEATECDLAIQNLASGGGEFYSHLYLAGNLSCGELRVEQLQLTGIVAEIKAGQGLLEANPLTFQIFGGNGRGNIQGVMTDESPKYTVDFAITQIAFEDVLTTFRNQPSIRGPLDLQAHLTMQGKTGKQATRTARGKVTIQGKNLLLETTDLDQMLAKYEKSQNFNLVDVGAFFIAGPLGTLLTKGYNFGSLYQESRGGTSTVQTLVSDWKVDNGVAEAEDVALATKENRIALTGKLDFVNQQFDNVTVAVLDEKGCARFSQTIHGPFRNPLVDPVRTLESMGGPMTNLFNKTMKFLRGGDCEIFYAGSVKHPK